LGKGIELTGPIKPAQNSDSEGNGILANVEFTPGKLDAADISLHDTFDGLGIMQ
jgi:hypothetical protein